MQKHLLSCLFMLLSFCTIAFLSACTQQESKAPPSSSAFPKSVQDFYDNTITFNTPAKTHIFLSFCEEVAMLQNWDDAVGLSRAVYHQEILRLSNPKIDSIPKVSGGGSSTISVESLKALAPDVVVVWAGDKRTIEFALMHNIKILALYPQNINEVLQNLELIASVFDKQKIINQKLQSTRIMLEQIAQTGNRVAQKKRVVYMWDKPTRIAGSVGMVGDMLQKIGANNLGSDVALDSYEISLEKLITFNPELILIWGGSRFEPSDILSNPQFQSIDAVRNQRVYKIPIWDNWGPRIVQTALLASVLCYPELYPNLDFAAAIEKLNLDLFGVNPPLESSVIQALKQINQATP